MPIISSFAIFVFAKRNDNILIMTSAFSCYSGCRQYRENVYAACAATDSDSLHFDKIRVFYNHPGFVEPFSEKVDSSSP